MFIIRHRLPSGDLSAKTDVILLRAINAAQELREAGSQDIMITDTTNGQEKPLEWWETISADDAATAGR
jgi:hypothetical protein